VRDKERKKEKERERERERERGRIVYREIVVLICASQSVCVDPLPEVSVIII
jgi:hypothetical protein